MLIEEMPHQSQGYFEMENSLKKDRVNFALQYYVYAHSTPIELQVIFFRICKNCNFCTLGGGYVVWIFQMGF